MTQISFYHTNSSVIFKVISQLLEKCYNSNLRVVLITASDKIIEIDKLLWTYARKQFLPHGTKHDTYSEKQPIYISDIIENPNDASILMLINPKNIESTTFSNFKRIIIILDEMQNEGSDVKDLLAKLNFSTQSYKQTSSGSWSKC